MPHTNSGMSNQPMPGARSLCIVAMKFSPVKIEENPSTKTALVISVTGAVGGGRVRRIESPAGVDRAQHHGQDRHAARRSATGKSSPDSAAEKPRPWRPASAAARNFRATPEPPGIMNRNTMIAPCSVNTRLYCSAVRSASCPNSMCVGVSSVNRTSSAKHAAHQERRHHAHQVHDPDALVIQRACPAPDPVVWLR